MSRLSMRKISEILRQRHELKCSYRDIARSLNISISTVSLYLSQAKKVNIAWPLPEEMSEEDLHDRIFLSTTKAEDKKAMPDFTKVYQEYRKKGMTLRLLWREYRDVHSDGLSYPRYCVHYRAYAKTMEPVMRQVHKAGEKAFVDYAGTTVEWINPTTGEIHVAQIFVGCLGASQLIFCEATATQSLPDWLSSHIHMFEYFGGVTEIVVPDNLKSAVTQAHRYDPDINANYQHFSEHYSFAIVPARVREPKDKALAENAVGIITRQILAALRHVTFTSIAEINAAIKPRLHILNHQYFQKMKMSRFQLFESIDKPALKALPQERYHYADWIKAKVHIDYHFIFDNHYYSVSYQYIHKEVQLRATNKTVECFLNGKRLASHARSYKKYGYTTIKEHMPPSHRAQAEWGPERMKRWAKKIGIHTEKFIDALMASRPFPQQAYRGCLGVLRLGERFGEDRLENACAIALSVGANRYKQIESILKKQLDKLPLSDESAETGASTPNHENIRGAEYFK